MKLTKTLFLVSVLAYWCCFLFIKFQNYLNGYLLLIPVVFSIVIFITLLVYAAKARNLRSIRFELIVFAVSITATILLIK